MSCPSPLPETVFEAIVGRSRENIVAAPQLLDIAKSLELRCVDDSDKERVCVCVCSGRLSSVLFL